MSGGMGEGRGDGQVRQRVRRRGEFLTAVSSRSQSPLLSRKRQGGCPHSGKKRD